MLRRLSIFIITLLALGLLVPGGPASAQLGKLKNKIKQKAEQKATEKAEEKADEEIDKALEGSGEAGEAEEGNPEESGGSEAGSGSEAESGSEAGGNGEASPAVTAGGTAASENMALYTKYDFVPGDKVLFYDDLSREEVGEFPSRWNLDAGVFEVARKGSKGFILCTDQGRIRPKVPTGSLPPMYTMELEFVTNPGDETQGHWFRIEWLDGEGERIGEVGMENSFQTHLDIRGKRLASKDLPAHLGPGVHTMRVMATKSSMKCYIDNERVANVPAVEGFQPASFVVFMDPWEAGLEENPMLAGTFRYAEGGKTLRQQLDEAGRIVTHGILFDSGSARIKAESHKTMADIGQLLTEDPALRLSIEGHTDSDGTDETNLTLSKDRAAAVRTYLSESYKIVGDRLETNGWGETKPIDTNDSPEGKANNRRVELIKL